MAYQSRPGQQSTNNETVQNDNINTDLSHQKQRDETAKKLASDKTAKNLAKRAATTFTGPAGAKAAELASKAKPVKKLINQGRKVLNGMPKMGNADRNLNDKNFNDNSNFIKKIKNKNSQDEVVKNVGGEQKNSSPPTSNGNASIKKIAGLNPFTKKRPSFLEEGDTKTKTTGDFSGFFVKRIIRSLIIFVLPIFLIFLLIISVIGTISSKVEDFEDAFGISLAAGEDTGDIDYEVISEDAKNFYDRVNLMKLSYQMSGKTIDVLKVAAVYHVLVHNNAQIDYDDMNDGRISEIVNAMFDGNSYNEEVFKNNLINNIFLNYFPTSSKLDRENMTEEVFDYIDDYYNFIGKESSINCGTLGSCNYDIKGFFFPGGAGNVSKSMQISNLMVRLMECGAPYGNGSYTTPIDQELVPFESYVAGVAYAEIGPSAPDEAIKAQMVVARSYALARPLAMNNAAGKKLEQENGQWILQISSCVADQVFCNIDQGCSYMGGGDGQGGIVRSGKVAGASRTRDSLPANHKLRALASEVEGEVLVNNQGNIISSGFLATEQNMFSALANKGLNYKQILMQVYNQGNRSYGAYDITKMSCANAGTCSNAASGPFANWKQTDATWGNIMIGTSGSTISDIGCLVTSVSMLVAKSGAQTNISNFNPGTFVEFLNSHNGFVGGNYTWNAVTQAVPSFSYQGKISVANKSRAEKLDILKGLLAQGAYVVAEVKGNTGQHWVAIDSITANNQIVMMDPGSQSTDMWAQYPWTNTSQFAYYFKR